MDNKVGSSRKAYNCPYLNVKIPTFEDKKVCSKVG